MNEQERHLAEELRRLDPRLAALLTEGLRLSEATEEAGNAFLIAHCGRELSRGVVALVAGAGEAEGASGEGSPKARDANRKRIARVLGVDSEDPRATRWFELVDHFSASNKFRLDPTDCAQVAAWFKEFVAVLFGRLGPFFEAQDDLDRLLGLATPTEADVPSLRAALGRPALRQYFFERVSHVEWLPLLHAAKLLAWPAPPIVGPNGMARMPVWPEGALLVKAAAHYPELTCDIALTIPTANDNVTAWRRLAELAKALPSPFAGKVAARISGALRSTAYPRLVAFACFSLVPHLARQGDEAAFILAESLLLIYRPKRRKGGAGAPTTVPSELADERPVLQVIGRDDVEHFLEEALAPLIAYDPGRTVTFLIGRLQNALKGSVAAQGRTAGRGSKAWCRDIAAPDRNDPRAQIAGALLDAAIAVGRRGPEDAEWVLTQLAEYEEDIFTRIGLLVLAEVGDKVPARLERAICADETLESPWGARESAALLRKQFANVRPLVQEVLAHAIEKGPGPEYLQGMIRVGEMFGQGNEDLTHMVQGWQRARLMWFEGAIPAAFVSLAEKLGVMGEVPTHKDKNLEYDGMHSEGGVWAGERSPYSEEELRGTPAEQLYSKVTGWQSEQERHDGPSRRGLFQTLARVVAADAERRLALARQCAASPQQSAEVVSVLFTLKPHAEAARGPEEWEVLVGLLRTAVDRWPEHLTSSTLRQAILDGLRCLSDAVDRDELASGTLDTVWALADKALLLSDQQAAESGPPALVNVMFQVDDLFARVALTAILSVAMWDYRQNVVQGELGNDAARASLQARLVSSVESALTLEGPPRRGVRAVLGDYLPQLWAFAPDWFVAAREVLLKDAIEAPAENPLWASYLVRNPCYKDLFPLLLPWYRESATQLPETKDGSSSFSLLEALVNHLLTATFMGGLPIGGEGDALGVLLDRMPAKERAHAYWGIFRGYSDLEEPPSSDHVARVVEMWRWRVQQLQGGGGGEGRAVEAAGLAWLIVTPYLPPADVLALARPTLEMRGQEELPPDLWDKLGELADHDIVAAFEITEMCLRQEAKRDYAHLPAEEVGPALRKALASADAALRNRARQLVHWLGETFSNDYRTLLPPNDEESGGAKAGA